MIYNLIGRTIVYAGAVAGVAFLVTGIWVWATMTLAHVQGISY